MMDAAPEDQTAALVELADAYDLADIYVFGSRAPEFAAATEAPPDGHRLPDGGAARDADLDIGVRPIRGRRLSARQRADLAVAFEDVFDVTRVDLVVVTEAPPFLALAVISGELLYCRDATDQAEYELYVLRRAGDLAPFERERRAHILGDDPQRIDREI